MTNEENNVGNDNDRRDVPLAGGGCACGCCGDATASPPSRQEEIAELKRLRDQTERRLAELDRQVG